MAKGITRRRLLESSAFCLVGLTLHACAEEPKSSIVDQLARFPAVRRVGRTYLSANPAENDAERLADLLPESWDRIEAEIRGDFAVGRVVRLSGWLLSLTEARLYALASFGSGD